MPRPSPDTKALKRAMLDTAQTLLAETGGRRLVMSDVAKRLGMSQSYAHRFFPTKHDLVAGLAERWFSEIESAWEEIVKMDLPAHERLEQLVLTTLQLKRARFDENPQLFIAYLDLAKDHMDLVQRHTAAMHRITFQLVREIVSEEKAQAATQIFEDATWRFRQPAAIAQMRATATDERARAVIAVALAGIRSI